MKKIVVLFALAIFVTNINASNIDAAKEKAIQDLYWKAVKLYNEENYAKALLYFNSILDQDSENYEYNYYVGLCYFQMNQKKLAKYYFRNVTDDNVYKMKITLVTRIESDGENEVLP
jgi:tetratricopeptide (TPR) repeat protein